MSIWNKECMGFNPAPDLPSFHEQWVSGTYLVTGVFPSSVKDLTSNQIQQNIPGFYDQIRANQKGGWPRGLAGYYVIPVYCSEYFSKEVIDWVSRRPKYKWAIWHEPILFHIKENAARMNTRWGLYGKAFRVFLAMVSINIVCVESRSFGFSNRPTLNGNLVDEKFNTTVAAGTKNYQNSFKSSI